jgi:hypothetical protein
MTIQNTVVYSICALLCAHQKMGVKTRNACSNGAAAGSEEVSLPLKVVHVNYVDTIHGHETMGQIVGSECRVQIQRAVAADPEIKLALKIVGESEAGKALYANFLRRIEDKYPKYLAELRGIRKGAGVPLKTLIVSCLRQVVFSKFLAIFVLSLLVSFYKSH